MLYIGDKKVAPIVQVPSKNNGKFNVRCIDYDGTVIKQAFLNAGEKFNLPTAPTHSRLTFDCWSSSAPIVDNQVTVTNDDILIGPIYDTASGYTEFDIYVPPSSVGVSGRFEVSGTKDWGDGSSTDTATSHTYAASGFYTIKVDATSLGGGQYNNIFVGYDYETPKFRCIGVYINKKVTSISEYPFTKTWLQYLTIGSGISSLNSNFKTSGLVKVLIIPPAVTAIPADFIKNEKKDMVVLPSGLTSIGNGAFEGTSLLLMPIPAGCTTLGTSFLDQNNIKNIRLPEGITNVPAVRSRIPYVFIAPDSAESCTDFFNNPLQAFVAGKSFNTIGDGTFSYTNMQYLDFTKCEQVPTLASTNLDTGAYILVPQSLYSQWITETNWVSLADYIIGV